MTNTLPSGITVEELKSLCSLVKKYDTLVKSRIAFENRIRSIKNEITSKCELGIVVEESIVDGLKVNDRKVFGLKVFEVEIEVQIRNIVLKHTLWWSVFKNIEGIGTTLAGKIIANIEPYYAGIEVKEYRDGKETIRKLTPPKSRSALNKLFGYSVDDSGRAERMKQGQKSVGSRKKKALMYNVFLSCIKKKGKARAVYDEIYKKIEKRYPSYLLKNYGTADREVAKKKYGYVPSVFDLARRKWIKVFLSLLWEEFNKLYNLPITLPQAERGVPLKEEDRYRIEDFLG